MRKGVLVCVTFLVSTLALLGADVSGKWVYERPGRPGGTPGIVNLNLKADGSQLSGTVSSSGDEVQISNGKIDGNNISFEVKRGASTVTKYDGSISGDELKLKITREAITGTVANKVIAKRSTN